MKNIDDFVSSLLDVLKSLLKEHDTRIDRVMAIIHTRANQADGNFLVGAPPSNRRAFPRKKSKEKDCQVNSNF